MPQGPVATASNDTAALRSRSGLSGGGPAAVAQRKELYDEPYRRMDGWLDGLRDRALYGDRRVTSGSAGRRDYQDIQ
jgi:hypothetical protein